MAKLDFKADTLLYPIPVVFISCADKAGQSDIMTAAWTGVVNSEPPMVSVSIRPSRLSYKMIKETSEFIINLPSANQLKALDYCGVVSGRDIDKFEKLNLSKESASKVQCPMILECPVNLECKVKQAISLGSHDLFLAEVLATHIDESVLDEKKRLDPSKADPIAYMPGIAQYWNLKESLGRFGLSLKKD